MQSLFGSSSLKDIFKVDINESSIIRNMTKKYGDDDYILVLGSRTIGTRVYDTIELFGILPSAGIHRKASIWNKHKEELTGRYLFGANIKGYSNHVKYIEGNFYQLLGS